MGIRTATNKVGVTNERRHTKSGRYEVDRTEALGGPIGATLDCG